MALLPDVNDQSTVNSANAIAKKPKAGLIIICLINFAGCGEPAAQSAGVPGAGQQDDQLPAAAGDAEQLRGSAV